MTPPTQDEPRLSPTVSMSPPRDCRHPSRAEPLSQREPSRDALPPDIAPKMSPRVKATMHTSGIAPLRAAYYRRARPPTQPMRPCRQDHHALAQPAPACRLSEPASPSHQRPHEECRPPELARTHMSVPLFGRPTRPSVFGPPHGTLRVQITPRPDTEPPCPHDHVVGRSHHHSHAKSSTHPEHDGNLANASTLAARGRAPTLHPSARRLCMGVLGMLA
jgi:hypothetical protein